MLVVKQRSLLSGSSYDVFDASGSLVGEVVWPMLAQARNARLKWHGGNSEDGEIQLRYLGERGRVAWECTRRGFTNDIRFLLVGGNGQVAAADVVFREGLAQHEIFVRQPFEGRLEDDSTWSKTKYRLFEGDVQLGVIEERSLVTIKRSMVVDLPDRFAGLMQLFFFFLVHNSAFR